MIFEWRMNMNRIYKRPEYIDYQIALDGFTKIRAELNDYIENDPEKFTQRFKEIKNNAFEGDTIAMDALAYYYKSGVPNLLPENYERYLKWELIAAARGNEFAIEKLQFMLNYAYNAIMDCDDYDTIVYKNDIEDYNTMYVLGKAICKILVRELEYFPIDIVKEPDDYKPYTQEAFILFRKKVDEIIPKTIDFLKS